MDARDHGAEMSAGIEIAAEYAADKNGRMIPVTCGEAPCEFSRTWFEREGQVTGLKKALSMAKRLATGQAPSKRLIEYLDREIDKLISRDHE